MSGTNMKLLSYVLALFFLALLACQSYGRIDPDLLESDNLSGQDFSFKQLAGRDLSNKNLSNVNFNGANLEGVNFTNSDLTGATFKHAVMVRADFTDAKLDERWVPVIGLLVTLDGAGQDFQGVDLSGTYLPTANLAEADLSDANLSDAWLSSADLSNANLSGANLQGTALNSAILHNVNFTDASLNYYTNLSRATLTGATISSRQLLSNFVNLSCTRMPDGTIYRERDCQGILPP
jgi:uncharacterized protein YjbI with pentapeptide repeats